MTLRERIADWLTGGELTRMSKAQHEQAKAIQDYICDKVWLKRCLREIIKRGNTARPNGTVKAMVRIAREGLSDE